MHHVPLSTVREFINPSKFYQLMARSISGKLIQAIYQIWMSFPKNRLDHDLNIEIAKLNGKMD